MSEVGSGGVQSQTLIAQAEADPSATPTASPQPEEGKASSSTSPGAAGGGVPSTSADAKKAMSDAGEKIIAAGATKAGLGELKSDGTHQGNVLNAAKVFAKLTQLGKSDPAMKAECTKFLNELAVAGKGLYNWGLKLDGVALNQLPMFKGVDAVNQPTSTNGTASSAQGSSTPLNESSSGTPPNGAKGMSPDEVRTAVTPLLQQVAEIDKKGDAKTISLAEVGTALKSKDVDPRVQQLLTAVGKQIQQSGKDMTVADAANHVASLSASQQQQGGTQQTQAPQGESTTAQPTQASQGQQIDLTKLDVKQFIATVNTDTKNGITRTELEKAQGSDKIDAAGKQLLEMLLSKMPKDDSKAPTAPQLETLLLKAQQQQLQQLQQQPTQGGAR